MIEFSIEEFGRAVYLRERLQLGLETIEMSLERNHYLKYDKAFSVLPAELKTIWEKTFSYFPDGYFPDRFFTKDYFGSTIKATISPSTRLSAIFTYFDEKTQTWRNGIRTDDRKLEIIIDKLRESITAFKF